MISKSPVILVCGAGPTGLTLACALAERGLEVRIIEENPNPVKETRALGIQARTLEIFERLGVIEPFLQRGLRVNGLNIYDNKNKLLSIHLDHLETAYPFILSIPQEETEKILAHHLEKLGKKVERGTKLCSIQNGCAFLRHSNGEEELFSPAWVVGCDGAHSTVRHSLRFSFKGVALPEFFALADLKMETSLTHEEAHLFLSKEGICGCIPLPRAHEFRVIFPLREKAAPDLNFCRAQFEKRAPHFPVEITSGSWFSLFSIHRRIAPKFQKKHIFLAGDAAHIHSPVGGQGMNTGIQDAYNLAWKLALVHERRSPKKLLKSYNQERYPVAKRVLFFTTLATKLLLTEHAFLRRIFFFLVPHLNVQPKIADLTLRYKSRIIKQPWGDLFWKAPKIGTRAPDVEIARSGKKLFDYLHKQEHTLLIFGSISLDLKELLSLHRVSLFHSGDEEEIAQRYTAEKNSVFLIRPDGYIGYRSRTLKEKHFVRYLKKLFL